MRHTQHALSGSFAGVRTLPIQTGFNPDEPFCVSDRAVLYESGQGDLTMIVEAEWNRRLGRGFNSRRLHQERSRGF